MALEGGEGSASRPGRSLPRGKTRYPLYSRLGGPLGRSGQVRKISPPPGFDPRTVQPVAQSPYRLSYPGPLDIQRDNVIRGTESLLKCAGSSAQSGNSARLTEPIGPAPCSQKPKTFPHPEPNESSPRLCSFFMVLFNIMLPAMTGSSQLSLSFRFSYQNPV